MSRQYAHPRAKLRAVTESKVFKTLTPYEARAYMVLFSHADDASGECWPSTRSIGPRIGTTSGARIAATLRSLAAKGLIVEVKKGGPGTPSRYRLLEVESPQETQNPPSNPPKEPSKKKTGVRLRRVKEDEGACDPWEDASKHLVERLFSAPRCHLKSRAWARQRLIAIGEQAFRRAIAIANLGADDGVKFNPELEEHDTTGLVVTALKKPKWAKEHLAEVKRRRAERNGTAPDEELPPDHQGYFEMLDTIKTRAERRQRVA